ncbi:MAG: HD domain-containing protein [Clostridiales bacterium]|nr:MAG: HD domain-containing protein [Clostridiales bacterium]
MERLNLKTDKYGLSWQDCRNISVASSLHDIGKVLIDPAILNKPGKLTAKEYEIMKEHTVLGEKILHRGELASFQNEPLLKTAIQICRYHHERYDGKGYPDGLCGDDIPIAAQVVGIADVYDALVNDRSYKKRQFRVKLRWK